MATRGRLAGAVRPAPQVRQWHAERARRAAQAASTRVPPGQRYSWPADRQAIIMATVAAVRAESVPAEAPDEQRTRARGREEVIV